MTTAPSRLDVQLTDSQRQAHSPAVQRELTTLLDGDEESASEMLEYVFMLIGAKKTRAEINTDLEELLSAEKAQAFTQFLFTTFAGEQSAEPSSSSASAESVPVDKTDITAPAATTTTAQQHQSPSTEQPKPVSPSPRSQSQRQASDQQHLGRRRSRDERDDRRYVEQRSRPSRDRYGDAPQDVRDMRGPPPPQQSHYDPYYDQRTGPPRNGSDHSNNLYQSPAWRDHSGMQQASRPTYDGQRQADRAPVVDNQQPRKKRQIVLKRDREMAANQQHHQEHPASYEQTQQQQQQPVNGHTRVVNQPHIGTESKFSITFANRRTIVKPQPADDQPQQPHNKAEQLPSATPTTKVESATEQAPPSSQSEADGMYDDEEVIVTTQQQQQPQHQASTAGVDSKKERCIFYPNCTKGTSCPFFHPTDKCQFFPNCSFGDKCLNIHPACRFGYDCTNPHCPYSHPPGMKRSASTHTKSTPAAVPCKFGAACTRPGCFFSHPPKKQSATAGGRQVCRFDAFCNNLQCDRAHPARDMTAGISSKPEPVFKPFTAIKSAVKTEIKPEVKQQPLEQNDSVDHLSSTLPKTPPREQIEAQ